ncbi:helix-turn-helix transcriptional regulator [Clostridium botulinum]|nr:helix-turn-helix transcriptional regulator [Clostridium botulinum]NFO52086.1 helix-turn-helix transcriptional regulator [Clostridium botulinum]
MNLGSAIKRVRQNKGLTQKQLAEELKVNINTIQNYENGRREPKMETILKICDILNCAPMEILSFEDFEKSLEKMKENTNRKNLSVNYITNKINEVLIDLKNTGGITGFDEDIIKEHLKYLYGNEMQLDMLKELIFAKGYDVEKLDINMLNNIDKKFSDILELEFYKLNK